MKSDKIPYEQALFFTTLVKKTRKLYLTKSGNLRKKINQKEQYQKGILETCLRINSLLATLRLSGFFIDVNEKESMMMLN